MRFLKKKGYLKFIVLSISLLLVLTFAVGCDNDSGSSSSEYTVQVAGVKDSQDIEAFEVVYDGDKVLEFDEDSYDAEENNLSAVVVSSKGDFELNIDNEKLAESYDPKEGYVNFEALESMADNKKEFTAEWTYFVENEQEFEEALNPGVNDNDEEIGHITFKSDLTGNFSLTENPRDIIINAEDYEIAGNLTIGDGQKDVDVEIRNLEMKEPNQVNVDVQQGDVVINGTSDIYGILIQSVGSNSLELREKVKAEWIKNNHSGANIKLLEDSYVNRMTFSSSGSLQGSNRINNLEKINSDITIDLSQDNNDSEEDNSLGKISKVIKTTNRSSTGSIGNIRITESTEAVPAEGNTTAASHDITFKVDILYPEKYNDLNIIFKADEYSNNIEANYKDDIITITEGINSGASFSALDLENAIHELQNTDAYIFDNIEVINNNSSKETGLSSTAWANANDVNIKGGVDQVLGEIKFDINNVFAAHSDLDGEGDQIVIDLSDNTDLGNQTFTAVKNHGKQTHYFDPGTTINDTAKSLADAIETDGKLNVNANAVEKTVTITEISPAKNGGIENNYLMADHVNNPYFRPSYIFELLRAVNHSQEMIAKFMDEQGNLLRKIIHFENGGSGSLVVNTNTHSDIISQAEVISKVLESQTEIGKNHRVYNEDSKIKIVPNVGHKSNLDVDFKVQHSINDLSKKQ